MEKQVEMLKQRVSQEEELAAREETCKKKERILEGLAEIESDLEKRRELVEKKEPEVAQKEMTLEAEKKEQKEKLSHVLTSAFHIFFGSRGPGGDDSNSLMIPTPTTQDRNNFL